jgi:hypothetical protein
MIPILGMPGPQTPVRLLHKYVCRGAVGFVEGGGTIDATRTRDLSNTIAPTLLNPGLLMGRITASGRYANSIIGVTAAATLANATSFTIPAAAAAELVRRNGATGTLSLAGPPTASGTMAVQTVTYTAVNQTTGVVTCDAIAAATIAGSLVGGGDGSESPRTFIPDGYGVTIGVSGQPIPPISPFPWIPREGVYEVAQIVNWPSNAVLQAWIRAALDAVGRNSLLASDQM